MAVDYSSEIVPAQENQPPSIIARIESHPYISIALALGIAIVLGYAWNKVHGTSSTPTTNAPGTSQGLPTTDANGNPVYYVPTSNTFLDYNHIVGSYNNTTTNNNEDHDPSPIQPPPVPAPKYAVAGINFPLIAWGQYKGPAFGTFKNGTMFKFNNVTYKLIEGSDQRIWGINPSGQQILLYGEKQGYPGGNDYSGPPLPPPPPA